MKKLCFFLLVSATSAQIIVSQTITEILNVDSLNFYEKVKLIEQNDRTVYNNSDTSEQKRYGRWQQFWSKRVDSLGRFTAYPQLVMEYIKNKQSNKSLTFTPHFELIGPFENQMYGTSGGYSSTPLKNYIGQVRSVLINPYNPDIVYIGTQGGGIFKSTNAMAANPADVIWENITDNYFGIGVKNMEFEPNNPDVIYAVTGTHVSGLINESPSLNGGDYGIGIFKTADAGVTWEQILSFPPSDRIYLSAITIDENNPGTMYAVAQFSVYKTDDNGVTWNILNVTPPVETWFKDLVIDYTSNKIYVGGQANLFVSDDGGITWTDISSYLPYSCSFSFDYNPVEPGGYSLWALFAPSGSPGTAYLKKSNDCGMTWVTVANNISSAAGYCVTLKISDNGKIYAGGVTMRYSGNNGINFNPLQPFPNNNIHADCRDVGFAGGTNNPAIIVTDGGVLRNTTGLQSGWVGISGNLSVSQFYSLTYYRDDPNILLGGTADCGTLKRFSDGTWGHMIGGDGGSAIISRDNPNTMFGVPNMDLYRSWNNNFYFGSAGPSVDLKYYDSPIMQNPMNAETIYAGEWWLKRAKNKPNTGSDYTLGWALYPFPPNNCGLVTSFAICQNDTNHVAVGSALPWRNYYINPYNDPCGDLTSLFITHDAGLSWVHADNYFETNFGIAFFNTVHIADIEFDPNDGNRIWVVFSGFEDGKHIFYSKDGGLTWTNITYDLQNIPTNCIKYDPVNQGVFLGTDFGIYFLSDGSASWDKLDKINCGFPDVIVNDLNISYEYGKLIVGTYGRSAWFADIYCFYNSLNPLLITNNTTWTTDKILNQDLVIKQGNTLIINSVVKAHKECKIIVEPGAKLILDGSLLTHLDICGNEMWQGIEVQGTSTASQYPALNNPNQGRVELKNGAVIENALTGIKVFATDANGDIIANTTGGIVVATNATFRNNKIAVHFEPYNNFYPTPASPRNNLSYFKNCTFETTQELNDNTQHPQAFVLLNGVNGITFHGNTFSNTATPEFELTKRGIGIKSINSGYNVSANCISQVQPCTNYDRNEFTGLYYGIYAQNATSAYPITIDRNSFIKNNRGVFLSGINNARVINNEFDVGRTEIITYPTGSKGPVPPPIPVSVIFYGYGLYLSDVPNFDVQENEFYSTDNGHYGSIVQNGGANPKDFYNNGYRDLRVGFQSGSDNSGMQIKCNRFIQNLTDADIGLTSGTIADPQGKCILNNTLLPAGNQFSYTNFDIKANNGVTPFRYRHHSGSPTTPQNFTPIIVNPFQCQADFSTASCPSRLNTEITTLQLLTNINTLNNQINTLKTQIDGGSTQEMLDKVASNMSSAQLKDELVTASPYLSDTVMISTLTRTQPLTPGHIKEVLVPNSPLTKKVLTVFDEQTLPQGIKDEVMTAQTGTSERALLEQEINTVELEKNIAVNQLVNLYMEDTAGAGMENIIAFYETQTDAISQKMLVNRYLSNSECIKAKETLEKLAKNNTEEITYQSLFNILTELCNEGKTVYEMTETQAYAVGEIALTNTMAASKAQAIMTQVYGDRYWEVIEELLDFNVQTIKGILTENAECGGAPVANVQIVLIDERGNTVKGLTPVFTNQNGEFSFSLNEIKCLDLNALFAINTQNGYSLSAKIYQTISQWIEQSPVTIEFKNVNLEWADNYSSPDSLMNIGTAIDITGNIYVAGRAAQNSPGGIHDDIVLLKYSPRGEMLWNRLFNAAKTSSEYTDDIAVDSEGNCYISVNSTTSNVVLVKYTPSGNLEWQSSLQTGANVQCKSNGIEIDSQGNICIAGYVKDVYGGKSDFLAASYSKTGTLNWYRTYNKEEYDYATDIKTDKQRNVIITGYANNPGTTTNSLITLKYSKNGILQWMKEHGNRGEQCFSEKMAVSDNGDIYLAGYCDFNINVIKYSSQGSLMWGKSHQTPTSDWINDITIDGNGNIIVTGCSNEDIIVIKYTSGGGVDWLGTYNGEKGSRDVGMAVTIDAENNIYITGVSGSLPMPPQPPPGKQREEIILKDYNYDIITMKYNSSGGKEWIEHYSLVPDKKNAGFALAVSENNNVYITGTCIDNNLSYMTTLKYSQCPAQASLRISEIKEPETDETGSDIQIISFGENTITVYPNPYSDNTVIELIAKTESEVKLEVYTLTGQFVSNVYTGTLKSGTYKYDFSAKKLGYSAGTYILRAAINNEVSSYWLVEMR